MSLNKLEKIVELIKNEKVIILPTDTVYGLLCRYDSKSAVEKIYNLKKRERKKPLILLGYSWNVLKKFIKLNDFIKLEIKKLKLLWPGAYTLVLPASKEVPKFLNEGFSSIGIRIPDNKFLLDILKHCPGGVLASTSANISGKSDKYPQKMLLKQVNYFLKAKKNEMSLNPSTIIQVKKNKIIFLR